MAHGRVTGASPKSGSQPEQRKETPLNAGEYLRQATRLADRGLWPEALALVQRMVAESPNATAAEIDADAALLLGRCLIELGQYREARQVLSQLLVQPAALTEAHWAQAQFLIATSYHRMGQSSRAAREFLRIDALAADELWRERSVRQASRCYAALGRVEAAEQLRQRAETLATTHQGSNQHRRAG